MIKIALHLINRRNRIPLHRRVPIAIGKERSGKENRHESGD